MENKEQNLSDICDEIFYNNDGELAGSVGVKNLSDTLKMTDKELDEYLQDL